MKRKFFSKTIKQSFLAVPAAALMLGAAQAGTTVGLNFQVWYYDSGMSPQTIGFNNGYSDYAATGLPVTTNAFGVNAADWYNADPIGGAYTFGGTVSFVPDQPCTFGGTQTNFAGELSCAVTVPDGCYFSGAGCIPPLTDAYNYPSYAPGVWCPPGDDEVFWGEIYGNVTNPFSISVSGLAAKFPNGYVVQSMSGLGGNGGGSSGINLFTNLPSVAFSDGVTTNVANYHLWYVTNSPGVQWPVSSVGVSDPGGVFTADTLYISSRPDATNEPATLAGYIITDQPVLTWVGKEGLSPSSTPVITNDIPDGSALTLNAFAIGVPPLSYQWQLNGTNIPGATFLNYTNPGMSLASGGIYSLMVTNQYGAVTSAVASVVMIPPTPWVWAGNVNGTWDINATVNWTTNGVATTYPDAVNAQFDDTGISTIVSNAVTVSPALVTVTNNAKNYTIGGSPIAGVTGLAKSGAGNLTLTGTNTFTGNISINGGALAIAGSGLLGGGVYNGAVTNNSLLIFESASPQTISGSIAGSGTLVQDAGTLTFTANQPLTGGVVINGGTNVVAVDNFGGQFTPSLVTINTNGTLLGNSVHALGDGTSVFINRGTWLLNDEDYKTNLTMVDGLIAPGGGGDGQGLRVGLDSASGTWTWYVSNSIAGSFINAPLDTVNSGVTLDLNVQRGLAVSDLTINGVVSDGGNLVFSGNGITTFASGSTYSGTTTVNGGTLVVTGQTGGGAMSVAAGAALLIPNGSISGPTTISGLLSAGLPDTIAYPYIGNTLTLNPGSTTYLKISKTGGSIAADQVQGLVSVAYGGTLVVSNITSDSTALAAGDTFSLFSANSYGRVFDSFDLPALPAGLNWDVSQLPVNGSITITTTTAPPIFNPSGGNYIGAQTVTINSLTPGATIYYTTNGSTPTVSSPSGMAPVTVMVPVNVSGFVISAYAVASGYSASSVQTATYYTVATPTWINAAGGSWQTGGNWSNNVIANASGETADFSQLTLSSSPTTVTLDGSPTAGQLIFGDQANANGWEIDPGNGGTLTLNNGTNRPVINVINTNTTITTVIAGTSGLAKTGAGSLTLSANNTYTGGTVVNAGTLVLAAGGVSGTVGGTVTVNPGATLLTTASDAFGYSGSIWVRTLNLYGGTFVSTAPNNEGWGLTINLMGGTIEAGTGQIAAGDGTTVNTLATNVPSVIGQNILLRESNTNNQAFFNVAPGTASPDLLISGNISQQVSGYGIVKSGAGVMTLAGTNTYTGATSLTGGKVLVTGSLGNSAVTVASGAVLAGNGLIAGPVAIAAGGTLQAGLGGSDTSALTVDNTLALSGTASSVINRAGVPNAALVTGISTLTYGGTLTVTNAGTTLQAGDTFQLFNATNYAGSFATLNLPALGAGLSWSNSLAVNGSIAVVTGSPVNTTPTNIVTSVSGGTLTLSWPADHTGWRLLVQTNHLSAGISVNPGDWGTVSGSAATNEVQLTIDPTKPTEFYQLVYP